ncbi:MAG: Na(+)/H(+) antiporter subunit C [Sandaracinaceae bacterium]|nr:Na(+)/H(+) antiporter subunit C [Sandaracinaceae bacterium]
MNHQLEIALLIGILMSAAVFLCLSRRLPHILFGFLLLSNGANLIVLAVSGDPSGCAPAVVGGEGPFVDPLPQALILTAIVIGFSVAAYLTIFLYRHFLDENRGEPSGAKLETPRGVANRSESQGSTSASSERTASAMHSSAEGGQ